MDHEETFDSLAWLRKATAMVVRRRRSYGVSDEKPQYPSIEDQSAEAIMRLWLKCRSSNVCREEARKYLFRIVRSIVVDDLRSHRQTYCLTAGDEPVVWDEANTDSGETTFQEIRLVQQLTGVEQWILRFLLFIRRPHTDDAFRRAFRHTLGVNDAHVRKCIQRIKEKAQMLPSVGSHRTDDPEYSRLQKPDGYSDVVDKIASTLVNRVYNDLSLTIKSQDELTSDLVRRASSDLGIMMGNANQRHQLRLELAFDCNIKAAAVLLLGIDRLLGSDLDTETLVRRCARPHCMALAHCISATVAAICLGMNKAFLVLGPTLAMFPKFSNNWLREHREWIVEQRQMKLDTEGSSE